MHQFTFNYLPNFKSIMGKIKQGILGGFSGKVANVVGSSWKGIAVMKSLPLSVANPKTAAQILQRRRFSILVSMAASILTSVVKPLWDRFAQKMSGFNDFVSKNFEAFNTGLYTLDYDKIRISIGKMLAPATLTATWLTPLSVKIDWTSNPADSFALDTDIPYIVALDTDTDEVVSLPVGEAVRVDGTVTVDTELTLDSTHYHHIYLAFKRADGTIVSDSLNGHLAPDE